MPHARTTIFAGCLTRNTSDIITNSPSGLVPIHPRGPAMVSTNNLKNGMTLLLEGKLWNVVENQHHKPGKGQAVVRTKLKEVESGKVVERTFRSAENVEQAYLERKTLQYLYQDGDEFAVMNTETFEQRNLTAAVMGDSIKWIREGENIDVTEFDGRIIGTEIATTVSLEVTYTEPGLAGNTATNTLKPATLETGAEVDVPLFITIGEKIKVDTRTGEYQSRA
jgi:elongation factor P